jgi:hypothetical protein
MNFCFENRVPLDRETVFAFHQNPARLELLHAGWSATRVLAHAGNVHVGAETWIKVTLAGFLPLVLGFRHTVCEPPFRFGEEQMHGPFSRFIMSINSDRKDAKPLSAIYSLFLCHGTTAANSQCSTSLPRVSAACLRSAGSHFHV